MTQEAYSQEEELLLQEVDRVKYYDAWRVAVKEKDKCYRKSMEFTNDLIAISNTSVLDRIKFIFNRGRIKEILNK